MTVSRPAALAVSGITAAAGLLCVLAMTPTVSGGLPVAATLALGCSATSHIDSQWGAGTSGGQILTVTIANTSPATATNWTVTWTLAGGQRVLSAWNATVSTTGTTVTAVNAPYNGVLAPGASTSFGMQLAGVASAPMPSCDNGITAPTSSTPTISVPPDGSDLTVTQADNQKTVTLHTGDTLVVSLPSDYKPPKVTPVGVVVQRDVAGGYPTTQPLVARFTAAAPGRADVSTMTDAACNHQPTPCPSPTVPWIVHVIVTA